MEAALNAIWYSPETGHVGAQQLYKRAREQGVAVTMKAVREWLQRQELHATYAHNGMDRKPGRRKWGRDQPQPVGNQFKISDVPNSYVADSVFMDAYKKLNQGYRGYMLFIEITTRRVSAYPFKTGDDKSPPTAQEARDIIARFDAERVAEKHPMARLSSDQGTEFSNRLVQGFLHEHMVQQYFHRAEDHRANGLLNAAVRVVRRIINLHMEHTKSSRWLDALPQAVANWNSHVIAPLKASPDELYGSVQKRQQIRLEALEHNNAVWAKTAFQDHPTVQRFLRRGTKGKGLFAKEGANWEGQYTVGQRQGWSYSLLKDGEPLKEGKDDKFTLRYRPYELKRVQFKKPEVAPKAPEVEEEAPAAVRRSARNAAKVRAEVGKGAEKRIVREKRQVKAAAKVNVAAAAVKKRGPAVGAVKGRKTVEAIPERVLAHKYINGRLHFKMKWQGRTEAESQKLPWEPLRIFKAIDPSDGQIGIMEPAYSYMVQHALDDED